jgi:hypothetical protein
VADPRYPLIKVEMLMVTNIDQDRCTGGFNCTWLWTWCVLCLDSSLESMMMCSSCQRQLEESVITLYRKDGNASAQGSLIRALVAGGLHLEQLLSSFGAIGVVSSHPIGLTVTHAA